MRVAPLQMVAPCASAHWQSPSATVAHQRAGPIVERRLKKAQARLTALFLIQVFFELPVLKRYTEIWKYMGVPEFLFYLI
jgi:hypothetical protein